MELWPTVVYYVESARGGRISLEDLRHELSRYDYGYSYQSLTDFEFALKEL